MDSKIDYPIFKRNCTHEVGLASFGHYTFSSLFGFRDRNGQPVCLARTVTFPDLAGRPKHVQRAILINTARALTDELWEDFMQWQTLNRNYPGVRAR